jgi:predicted dehydrogenase
MQAIKDGRYPYYLDDPHVKWGFWSWEPLYDYSLSGDQSVHHIRGMLFLLDYLSNSL